MRLKKLKKILCVCVIATLVVTQVPVVLSTSAQNRDEIHWTAEDVRVPTGQNYVDLVIVLDWGRTTPVPIDIAMLTFAFGPVGAFTLQNYTLAPGVTGTVNSHIGTITTPEPARSTIAFTIVGMDEFEGVVELRVRLGIANHALVNVGDHITISMLRAAMVGAPPIITGVTVVRCDCGDGCTICDDVGDTILPPVTGGGGNQGGGTGGNQGGGTGGNQGGGTGGNQGGGTGGNQGGGTGGNQGGGTGGNQGGGTGGNQGGGTGGNQGGGTGGNQGGGTGGNTPGGSSGGNPGSGLIPRTGDDANSILWIALFSVGALGLAGTITKIKLDKKKTKNFTIVIESDNAVESIITKE